MTNTLNTKWLILNKSQVLVLDMFHSKDGEVRTSSRMLVKESEGEEEEMKSRVNTTCSWRAWRSRRDGSEKENELGVHPTASAVSANPYAVMARYCLMTCSMPFKIRNIRTGNHGHQNTYSQIRGKYGTIVFFSRRAFIFLHELHISLHLFSSALEWERTHPHQANVRFV